MKIKYVYFLLSRKTTLSFTAVGAGDDRDKLMSVGNEQMKIIQRRRYVSDDNSYILIAIARLIFSDINFQ